MLDPTHLLCRIGLVQGKPRLLNNLASGVVVRAWVTQCGAQSCHKRSELKR